MRITQEHVGKKVILPWWKKTTWQKILYVGELKFFAVDIDGYEMSWLLDNTDWQLVEEKETV